MYLQLKNKVYHFRIKVPHKLIPVYSSPEIKCSLRTSNKREAQKIAIDQGSPEEERKALDVNQGKVRFMLYRETMTAKVLIKFLSRLIKDVDPKVFLILDNHRVHHSKAVKSWLDDHKERIEVFFLPPYAPEHNPDEYLNGDLKQKIRSGPPARGERDLAKKTGSFMKTLQTKTAPC